MMHPWIDLNFPASNKSNYSLKVTILSVLEENWDNNTNWVQHDYKMSPIWISVFRNQVNKSVVTIMATLQSITIDFIGKHINLYKRHLRYWPNLQSIVYKKLGYNIINESQIEETLMPYNVLSNKLNRLTNLVIQGDTLKMGQSKMSLANLLRE